MAWDHLLSRKADVYPMVIDIGTGTGVLAIAAACLGAKKVMALDMDACARFEAERNIGFNPKAACVMVMDRSLASIHVRFDLVMANLRLPTLAQLADWMEAHLEPSGCVVVSGCREEEWKPLTTSFAEKGLQSGWQKTLAGWAGGVFLPLCARASDMGTANDTQ
jgi:ribosomal protein L11 methyltransferase